MSINRIIFDLTDPSDPASYFDFDDMIGALQPMRNIANVINRPGARGESVQLAGTWAPPSKLTTMRFFADGDDAILILADYTGLIDGEPIGILMHGRNWGTFKVVDCQQAGPVRPVAAAAGTIEANPECCQIIDWTLINCDPPA